ncbi:MAG: hypothetical protein KF744_13860 [Taibaiella sp.]|nr:hypothetical protein [Taibaiella sp.]
MPKIDAERYQHFESALGRSLESSHSVDLWQLQTATSCVAHELAGPQPTRQTRASGVKQNAIFIFWMKVKIAVTFACIVLLYIGWSELIPNWTFRKDYLNIASRIIFEFSLLALIICVTLLLKANMKLIIILGVALSFAFIAIAWGEINPIDTTTEPKDKWTLERYTDGSKLTVREYQNAKTGEKITDTVRVHDYAIFRKFVGE